MFCIRFKEEDSSILVYSLHPGIIADTNLARNLFTGIKWLDIIIGLPLLIILKALGITSTL